MKLLKDIIYGVSIKNINGSTNTAIEHVACDSRKVTKFTIFTAINGTKFNGHKFIDNAIKLGACAIVCEKLPKNQDTNVTYIQVDDSSKALGIIASNFYDNPSEKLKLIGVTGTNGKTTSVNLLYDLFRLLGFKAGMISTVVNKVHNESVPSTHTTPDALDLNKLLSSMVIKGCSYVFMEVSSHSVDQERISGLHFYGSVFTNITRDHLDYHKTFDNYIAAKKKFFDDLPSTAFALINSDQKHSDAIISDSKAKVYSYGLNAISDFRGRILENRFDGMTLELDSKEICTKLIGRFNAYNALVAYATGVLLDQDKTDVLTTLSNLSAPEGRFEYRTSVGKVTAIVDYAHTPDALENVLKTIKNIRTGKELVITVFGCGGDRDKGKRPLMADIACQLSDQVIFTSDNPRTENPEVIIAEMEKGVPSTDFNKVLSIANRREAIKAACKMAHSGDILLVAGKGHEKYQEINGETLPFDDMQVVLETLKMMSK